MKLAAVIAAALTLAAAAASATAPAGFYEARRLEPAASFVAGKPSTIYCAKTMTDWRAYVLQRYNGHEGTAASGMPGAFTDSVGGSVSYFNPLYCIALFEALNGQIDLYAFPSAVTALVHEGIHARGVADEGQAECQAMHEVPRVAVKFFHVKAGKQLRAIMAEAWLYHRSMSPTFLSVC